MADCERCINEQRIKTLEESSKAMEISDAVKGSVQNQILSTLGRLEAKVDALESKPGKRWEELSNIIFKWAVLLVLGAAVIQYLN